MLKPRPENVCILIAGLFFSGCLYSTQHFNTGVILPAGKTQATLGAGRQPLWRCAHYQSDSTGVRHACNDDGTGTESITRSQVFKGSINYRLGIRDNWGPFPGAELEWHLELPTNPATMEFAMNLALPAGGAFHHKLGAGWGVGAWADNTIFAEYALSKSLGKHLLFGNFRTTWLATQIGDVLGEDFAKPFPSNQHFVFQTGAGFFYRLPDWIIVPDFIIPQVNLTVPTVPSGDQRFKAADIPLMQWDANLGLGWLF